MNNKLPPEPKVCKICEENFWGKSDAKTCSSTCRKRLQRLMNKRGEDEVRGD